MRRWFPLAVALACGYVIGFRFYRGPWYAVVFCLLTLLVGVALALLGDTLGTRSRDPAATAQWLLLPQLIFGFLSVGIQPLHRFSDWIQPIVDHQPIGAVELLAVKEEAGEPAQFGQVIGAAAGEEGQAGQRQLPQVVGDRPAGQHARLAVSPPALPQ